MVILTGIMSLIFLCGTIIILSSFPIALHESKGFIRKKSDRKDPFSYLFDVYGKSNG
ncbi:hypothetical protein [Fictibacillus phosphorivorans]|uniref:hypothetical protein n=1 Tax=Fictibacillus phosphorivorans TaxID=1221500 RepID=UPI00203C068F|nr:hypothetical protein [Fictibacillus phosphorivorans]MCM3719921.1 hypothetical protein [Fictibacillus phosphorivorans]MCM3777625.1 hypothetical protein [Fictibacillus phosphorivorans]